MDKKPKILIVDDEPTGREALEDLLFTQGYNLAFAGDGPETLAKVPEFTPDVILLDVLMPGMDGFEVCQYLKADERWRHIPIILITALDSKKDMVRGLDAGADDFLSKPISALELRARMRLMLRIKGQYDALQQRQQELQASLRELRQVSARNQTILDVLPYSMLYLTRAGKILDFKIVDSKYFWTASPVKMFLEDDLGKLLPAAGAALFRNHLNRAFATQEAQLFEFELGPADDRQFFEARLVVSGPDESLAIIRDITQRKQAEEALRDSEERLRSTISSMDDLVFVLDKNGVFIGYHQPPQREELYISPELLLGKSFQEVLPPHLIELLEAAINAVVDTGTVQQFDYELDIAGTELWFRAKVSRRQQSSGQFAGVTVVARDITEQRELDKMRDDFVATVTHELKTPLASIMGWTETLLEERPGPLNDTQRRFLSIVEESSERLEKLVEEILTVSRLQQGTLNLDIRSFSPHQTVENVQNLVLPLADEKSIALEIFDQWPPEEQFAGDQARLEQVIINLVGNAIKFTPDGGRVRVYSYRQSGSWYLRVEDTGIGIPKADISRLFQRFYRASNATESQIQGTGLGLYVCKAYVERHGGQIGLESEVGQGTTVWFTLPVVG